MSRNFELLKQLEIEVDQASPLRNETSSTPGKQISPADAARIFGAESVRLVQTVFLSTTQRSARRVVFCGVDDENGSSSVCANAAKALSAITDKSVCLVDADVRLQCLSSIFGIHRPVSFPSSASIREGCVHVEGNLWLAQGDLLVNDAGALLTAVELRHRFAQLSDAFHYLLVDAPAVGVSREAALIGEIVGATILVIEANSTRRQTARKAKDSLEASGVRLLGTVLRNRSFPIPEGLYKRL
jgi:Mrp family chromosome partitioning ATPase